MTLLLNGTNGVSDVDGTAATPAIRGTDTNTGIFFPAADTIAFAEGGVESMRIDSSGNVGIGTSSPAVPLHVVTTGSTVARFTRDLATDSVFSVGADNDGTILESSGVNTMRFFTSASERMRIDSSGNVFIGSTSFPVVGIEKFGVNGGTTIAAAFNSTGTTNPSMFVGNSSNGNVTLIRFSSGSSGNTIGNITGNGTNTTYSTSSDYRLKENIVPMTGALNVVQQLKPVTYNWKVDGSSGQGFIAHELQAVVPDCVTGEKDAVETVDDIDAEGKVIGTKEVPRYQGIDTSFLVATLTKAIQELNAKVDAQALEIQALKGVA